MIRKTLIAAASAAVVFGTAGAALATAGAASAATVSSQVTSVTNRDDSGYSAQIPSLNGNWATDTFTRTSSVTFVQQTSGTACKDLSPCYQFTGSIADNGTFLMDAGAVSPNAGAAVTGDPTGTMVGGDSGFTFYADAMPSTAPASSVSGDVPGTGNWLKGFFAAGTDFVDPSGTEGADASYLLGSDWGWTYYDGKSCQTFIDAAAVSQADSGDITGADNCVTSVTSPGNQSGTVGTPVSLQIAGSTTSTDDALTYAASGLPAGLSISASTGLITGTPATAENTDVVAVKVTDYAGHFAWTHFGFTVNAATVTPPPSTKLTVRYVCGRSASRVVWLVRNIQGAGPAIANFTSRVRKHWVFDGSAPIALNGSDRRITTAGTTLRVYYDANGSRQAPKEAGALSVTATAPLSKRCGS